jgi:hypothetical protein
MAPYPHLDRRPTVARRLPLPASAPPFDDELPRQDTVVGIRRDEHPWARHAVVPPTQGALALSFSLPGGVPAEPEASSELRLLTAAAPTEALPDPTRWTARLAQAIVESLYGPRPIQQLLRWTDDRVYRGLAQLAAGRPPGSRHLAPQLRAVRVCRVADRIAEATVVVQIGPRCRSLALRLIADESRWVCVSFDLV